jgi:serine/threonine protein kinase/tetratricopeptide (TPR) repeat protein
MKPEQWQEINLLFNSALEREPGQRAAFLNQACAGNESLRQEVEALIAAHDQAGSFIEAPAFAVAAEMLRGDQGQPLVGHSFGPYRIVAAIGAGGMGDVYLAQDTRLGRQVALKLLPTYFTSDAERVRRFQQEARAVSALNHPNIITIHEIGRVEERHFIATEFIDGETLRALLGRARLSLRATLDMAIQVASALVAAHKAGIVHRDIKPENVMVRREDGIVKVLDFGLVKLTEKHAPQYAESAAPTRAFVKTEAGVVMGTVSYMSPEQTRGLQVDARTDIWSLGVLLYEMVAGRMPFAGETASDVMASILKTEPLLLTRLMPKAPEELERIVSKALAKDREERYQTAKDLMIDLKRLKQRLDVEAEIERTSIPESGGPIAVLTTRGGQAAVETVHHSAALTGDGSNVAQPTSSAEYVVSKVKRHKAAAFVALAVLAIAFVAAFAYFSHYVSRSPGITSVAVLPFVNANGDAEIEYLSDGISESLINSLAQLPQLKVIARSSSFRYRSKDADPQEVAKALGVEVIMTGRVTQRGDGLVVSTELMDARDRTQIWGERYDRKLTDLPSLQGEIARDVSEKLHLRLTSSEQQGLARRGTENTEAYQAYLKGRYYWNRGLAPGYEKSRDFYQQAINLDPSYALAYSGLASYYGFLSANGLLPPDETWPRAEVAANQALALDPTLAEAFGGLAGVKLYYYRDWPTAERYFRRAIELNPKLAEVQMHYALNLNRFGRNEEALALGQRAVELEPLSLRLSQNWARLLYFVRQYDRAIDQFRKTLELDPNFPPAHEWLGYAYEQKGIQREAVAEWSKALSLSGASEQASSLERAYVTSGFEMAVRALAQQRLENLNERMKRSEYVPAFEYVTAYTRLGDKEQAVAWLDKAVQERNQFALEVKVNPLYDKLRDDLRFQDIVKKVGLPQ